MTHEEERGPVAVTTAPPSNAVEAIAGPTYSKSKAADNACQRTDPTGLAQVAYRSQAGRIWRYNGKRARVLAMLATMPGGVTQWDTLAWQTRLGGTIHAMRQDGLAIDTEREGEFRHARYRLATPGCLLEQPGNREAAA